MEQGNQTTPVSCPDCHALVADLAGHKAWHNRIVSDLANAIERDLDRRSKPQPAAP
jgi:hypothetical protein